MVTFQRARSEAQRDERRRAILDVAATMLAEMPAGEISLNELSRRIGLAKSNVLRYFDSREAVLLVVMELERERWLDELEDRLSAPLPDGERSRRDRGERLAALLAATLSERPVLLDLMSIHGTVLEHNVSPTMAAAHQRVSTAHRDRLASLCRRLVDELGSDGARAFASATLLVSGAVWVHCHPSQAILAASAADPESAPVPPDLDDSLQDLLAVLLFGQLKRPSARH